MQALSSPARHTLRRGLLMAGLVGIAVPVHAGSLGQGHSDFGGIGLMQTPTARMAPLGHFSASWSRTAPYRRYGIFFQPTEWLEGGFRYVEIEDRLFGEEIAGDRAYLDKGFDIKLRLWQESRYLPELAVGLLDAGGTTLFGAEYLVASKRWYDLDFHLGLGWGYLGRAGDMSNPLGRLDDRFYDRPRFAGSSDGGELSLSQMFRGPVAWFGGVEYQTPWDRLLLQVEVEGNDYSADRAESDLEQDSRVNLGARLRLTDNVELRAGWQRGNTAMLGVSLSTNLAGLSQIKRDPPPVPLEEATAWHTMDWGEVSHELESNAGLRVERIQTQESTLIVEGEPTRYRSLGQSGVRASRILHNHTASDIDTFEYRWSERGMPMRVDRVPRQAFLEAAAARDAEGDFYARLETYGRHQPSLADEYAEPLHVQHEAPRRRFSYGIGPALNQNFGGPDGYLYQLMLAANAEYRTDPNGWLSASLSWTLADNLDKYEYIAESDLPRVRTFIGDYLAETSLGLSNLQYTRTTTLGDDWYAMGYGGLLETMYAGVGGEVLYRPFGSRWALGADLNWVRQRAFDQRFGLRDYSIATGHLNAYWETGIEDVLAKVSVGRYLAGDIGATLDLSREFASGVRIGGWATLTDAGSDFGEGSFDKGLYLSMPLDAFFVRSSRDRARIAWQPLTRDGGARLHRRYPLYDLTQERQPERPEIDRRRDWE
ncbi:YjbH domain-containing protein [Halomonas sp. 328]|uniref:YjbH domain-containing protein n=1 Tax=Halomonas sp. 328 TaxID=2776704 RepID=UPI0018A77DA6|nr:YjbH domain-containing protein [Halomonas sp. 328]MBF8223918.1 YjbH domain-containing protein [Halomonas sp. 328]